MKRQCSCFLFAAFVVAASSRESAAEPGPPTTSQAAESDDIVVPAAPKKAAPSPTPVAVDTRALVEELRALRERVGELEEREKKRVAEPRPAPTPAPAATPAQPPTPTPTPAPAPATETTSILGLPIYTTTARPDTGNVLGPVGVVLSGYSQIQYLGSELSDDQLKQGGAPQNLDRFSLRLARLRLDGSWKWARFAVELSGNTQDGLYLGVLRAEAAVLYRNPTPGAMPYVMLTGGLQEIAYGYELPQGQRRRLFMERTQGSLALFPGTTDLGVRLSGGVSYFRYALAAMNGVPLQEKVGAGYAVTLKEKDLLGRVGLDTGSAARGWNVAAGVSFLAGNGLHAGGDATQPTTQWRDANENGVVDPGELVGVPARAAQPSKTFTRWAVGADAEVRFRTRIGWTTVYGEATLASNLDRALFVADPIAAGYDLRHIAAYAAFTQEIFRYGLVGFRWDYYNPDVDFTDARRGQRLAASNAIQTFSPLVGVQAFDHLRLLFQYDVIRDRLGRDASGTPIDLANNQSTVRLQGDF